MECRIGLYSYFLCFSPFPLFPPNTILPLKFAPEMELRSVDFLNPLRGRRVFTNVNQFDGIKTNLRTVRLYLGRGAPFLSVLRPVSPVAMKSVEMPCENTRASSNSRDLPQTHGCRSTRRANGSWGLDELQALQLATISDRRPETVMT
jgi:hypothetical protein